MPQPIRKLETTLSTVHSLGPGLGRVDLVGEGIGKGIQPGADSIAFSIVPTLIFVSPTTIRSVSWFAMLAKEPTL